MGEQRGQPPKLGIPHSVAVREHRLQQLALRATRRHDFAEVSPLHSPAGVHVHEALPRRSLHVPRRSRIEVEWRHTRQHAEQLGQRRRARALQAAYEDDAPRRARALAD